MFKKEKSKRMEKRKRERKRGEEEVGKMLALHVVNLISISISLYDSPYPAKNDLSIQSKSYGLSTTECS